MLFMTKEKRAAKKAELLRKENGKDRFEEISLGSTAEKF